MAETPSSLSGPLAKLVGVSDPIMGREVICAGVIKIGRDPHDNTFPVVHPSVSRKHARVLQEENDWVVEDLQSSNGVFVNDKRVQKETLKNGDVIRVGDITMKFTVSAPPPPVSAASADGFEPTLIAAAPKRKNDDDDFEGTMFGGQAASAFADALQKEAQERKAAVTTAAPGSAASAGPAMARPAAGNVPSMFMLKIKAALLFLCVAAVAGVFIGLVIHLANKDKGIKAARKEISKAVEAFVSSSETRVVDIKDAQKFYDEDLKSLAEIDKDIKKALTDFKSSSKEYLDQLENLQDNVSFLIFERHLLLALNQQNRDGVKALLDGVKAKNLPDQKDILKLAELIVKFKTFRIEYPDDPPRAEKVPDAAEVAELVSLVDTLKESFTQTTTRLRVPNSHFAKLAKEVTDTHPFIVRSWEEFFKYLREYDKLTNPEERAARLDEIKRRYPNNKRVKELK